MDYIKVSAKNVEEALTEASIELGTSSDNIEYEVIEKGSDGFLGFGRKPTVIRAWKKELPEEQPEEKTEAKPEKEAVKEPVISEEKEAPAETKAEPEPEAAPEEPVRKSRRAEKAPLDQSVAIQRAEEFLKATLGAMQMEVSIKSEFDEEGNLNVDLSGADMGVLIGKRGQTLDSIQYLTSLVVNKGNGAYVRVKVDTEDYRSRRKETLENLARNIASKVRRTRKPVFLEPMNPYERRIIHSALQNNPYVSTHSEGEEPYRKVVVTLKTREKEYNR